MPGLKKKPHNHCIKKLYVFLTDWEYKPRPRKHAASSTWQTQYPVTRTLNGTVVSLVRQGVPPGPASPAVGTAQIQVSGTTAYLRLQSPSTPGNTPKNGTVNQTDVLSTQNISPLIQSYPVLVQSSTCTSQLAQNLPIPVYSGVQVVQAMNATGGVTSNKTSLNSQRGVPVQVLSSPGSAATPARLSQSAQNHPVAVYSGVQVVQAMNATGGVTSNITSLNSQTGIPVQVLSSPRSAGFCQSPGESVLVRVNAINPPTAGSSPVGTIRVIPVSRAQSSSFHASPVYINNTSPVVHIQPTSSPTINNREILASQTSSGGTIRASTGSTNLTSFVDKILGSSVSDTCLTPFGSVPAHKINKGVTLNSPLTSSTEGIGAKESTRTSCLPTPSDGINSRYSNPAPIRQIVLPRPPSQGDTISFLTFKNAISQIIFKSPFCHSLFFCF